MKFEEKLIKLRKEKILSQEELAEKLEVTRQTISKWELGQSKPDMDKLVEMSKFFEVPVDSLTNENLDIENKVNVSSVQKKERKWLLYVFVIVLIVSIVTLIIRVNLQKEEEKANNKNNTGIFSIFDNMFGVFNDFTKDIYSQYEEATNEMEKEHEEKVNEMNEQSNKRIHNMKFESDTGTRATIFVENTLDDIISINKKNEGHIVTLVYNDVTTTDETKIKEIKHSLDQFKKYEVSVDYDENGYVNKVILEDI